MYTTKLNFKNIAVLLAVAATATFTSCGNSQEKTTTSDQATDSTTVAIPNMPATNPWLASSSYPIVHDNPGATDAVALAGPTKGKQLTEADVKAIPTVWTCSPTIKNVNGERIVIASSVEGIRKIKATGEDFELVSYLPYPGFESMEKDAQPDKIAEVLKKADAAYKAKDDAAIVALSKEMGDIGFRRTNIANGGYNMIDKDGYHYTFFGGLNIIKTFDDNDVNKPLRLVKVHNISADLPAEALRTKPHLTALSMSYDGHIMAGFQGGLIMYDRDFNKKGYIAFPQGETIDNNICIDEQATYVLTSRNMYKVVWTGSKLSYDEADGGWVSGYNTMTRDEAVKSGTLTVSGGSGTTPTLMGFGNDEDKLIVISDADPTGIHLVAFWRDEIPADFKQKPGTKSRRIADQIPVDITRITIEPSPAVLGYGVIVVNNKFEKPEPDNIWANAMTAGVTRPAPYGMQKFTWNPKTNAFEKNWTNMEIDNTDVMVPVISAASQMAYTASKTNGVYEYVGIDWNTGKITAHWPFPNDSRLWNNWGSITGMMEDGDLLLGGIFAFKRVNIGVNNK